MIRNIENLGGLFVFVGLAEWSKAIGLSPMTFECVGSNPTSNIKFFNFLFPVSDQKMVLFLPFRYFVFTLNVLPSQEV